MAEGLLDDDGTIRDAVHDDPDHEPEPTADAPRGWTWQRKDRRWAPRQRGPVKWQAGAPPAAAEREEPRAGGEQQRDPDPLWMRGEQQHQEQRQEQKQEFDPSKVSQETRDDIGGLLGLVAVAVCAPLAHADSICGSALADNADKIIEKIIPLVCRSERVVKWMQADGGGLMDWFGLAVALAPVAGAVLHHHILRDIDIAQVIDEHGETVSVIVRRDHDDHEA